MKLNKTLGLFLALPLILTACPGKKDAPPAPAASEPMVPATPPGDAGAAPADPNAAAPANPAGTEGGATTK